MEREGALQAEGSGGDTDLRADPGSAEPLGRLAVAGEGPRGIPRRDGLAWLPGRADAVLPPFVIPERQPGHRGSDQAWGSRSSPILEGSAGEGPGRTWVRVQTAAPNPTWLWGSSFQPLM